MADINDIKDTVLSTLGTVAGKAMDIADKTRETAKGVARIAKLSMEVNNEKAAVDKAYIEIGKLYYETRKDNPDGFFVQLCDEITLARENIDRLNEEIAALKAGDDKCCGDVEVEFTEVSDDEFEDAPAAEEKCCCGEAPAAEEKCCCEEAPAEENKTEE